MAKLTVAGHPVHPQLVHAPLALLPFSFALDAMHLATGRRTYAEAAYFSLVSGSASAVAAAAAGATDYFALPPGGHTKRLANVHAAMNVGLLALNGINLLLRRGKAVPTGPVPVALSAAGTVGLLVSAWYGASLVYHQGVRVQGIDPIAAAPKLKLPGDEKLEAAFERLAAVTPAEVAPATAAEPAPSSAPGGQTSAPTALA